jgi:hypothetical protein
VSESYWMQMSTPWLATAIKRLRKCGMINHNLMTMMTGGAISVLAAV